jgi:hypothetical protein
MDYNKATLIICVTLFLVIGFNAAIYAAVKRRKNEVGQIELIRRATMRARNPWQAEDSNLETLAKQVAALQQSAQPQDSAEDE